MPWVRLDDRFPSHRKVALLSDRAFRLHVSAICWCAENLTDGHISDRELTLVAHVRGMTATARQLEDAGLWERVDGGWAIHDYLDYNPSREQVIAERKKNAARQEAFRQRRNGKPIPPDGSDAPQSNGRSNGVTNGGTNAAPSRPDPTRTRSSSGEGRERGAGSDAREDHRSLSLITADWQPAEHDRTAAAAELTRLGPTATATATAKFVRHHQSRGTTATNFGPLWITWLTRERPDTQGTFLVGLPGGATPTPPSFAERMAALDAAAEADRRQDRTTGEAG